jgi:peptide/nickel transport system substrate-binding protein
VMNADARQVPLFGNKQLRKALHYAVDKKQILDKLLYGLADYGTCEWDGSPWQDPTLIKNEYDAARCQRALDELGWNRGPDGVRAKNGQRLSFTHSTTSGNQLREDVQLLVQQNYKDVGVEMTIKNGRTADEFGTWAQGGWWSRGNYMMGGWNHGLRVPDPEVSNRYLCSEIASESNQAGSQWYRYCNPRVDALLQEQAREFDAERRKRLIFQVEGILQDDAYWIYLYTVPLIYTVPSALKNFYLHPFANFYWNPQQWEWA